MKAFSKCIKLVSLLLAAAMVITIIPVNNSIPANAASDEELNSTRGVYYFSPHEYWDDLTDTYIYSDELLKGDSLEYNNKLATMSFELAVESVSSSREPKTEEGYKNKSRNIRAYLEDNGFIDFDTNDDYKTVMSYDTMGTACAHKEIVDNGKTYTLLVIVPRSAGYEAEWGGNVTTNEDENDTGDSAGFRRAKEKVLSFAKEYVSKYGIKGDIKVWTAGYSRGAGVTNQVGAALINDPVKYLGNSVTLKPENLYCYTFGTPNSASTSSEGGTEGLYNDPKFNYIHNVLESYDLITITPPKGLGFARYGTVTGYDNKDAAQKKKMLELLKVTNSYAYEAYTTSGDPDVFSPKTIDMDALINDRQIKISDDPDSYLPDNYRDFVAMLENSMVKAMGGSREKYYESHLQDGLRHLVGYFQSHVKDNGEFLGAVKANQNTIPMVAFMYISYMVERFNETTFDENTKAQIQQAIELLEAVIDEKEKAGEEVPEELTKQLAELKGVLSTANTWGEVQDTTRTIAGVLYSLVIADSLKAVGYDKEDPEAYAEMTDMAECMAITRAFSYLLMYDEKQTDKVLTFEGITQPFKHFATFVGNAGHYQRAHMNEVILSWLRTLDPSYDDFNKEGSAEIAGYRRLYIQQPDGVSVSGTVKDSSGKTVAEFKDGSITSRTDAWIGITTCDTGNWLRLPADKAYDVEIKVSKDASLSLKVCEYSVSEGSIVRTVESDSSFNWKSLTVNAKDGTTLKIPAVPGTNYQMPSKADYHIEKDSAEEISEAKSIVVAKGIAKGKKSIRISWNKVTGASRYQVYFGKVGKSMKKVKTVKAGTRTVTRRSLKTNTKYQFYVVAQKKENGKYKTIAKSKKGYVITGNLAKSYTNPRKLKVNKSKVTLEKGKTFNIKASVTKVKAKKKLLTKTSKFRYISNNTSVAKVSSKGKVTAVASGSCTIYVQTVNGMWKTVKVTVK